MSVYLTMEDVITCVKTLRVRVCVAAIQGSNYSQIPGVAKVLCRCFNRYRNDYKHAATEVKYLLSYGICMQDIPSLKHVKMLQTT